jgi:hypothetical protein
MEVVDVDGDKVGTVSHVQMADLNDRGDVDSSTDAVNVGLFDVTDTDVGGEDRSLLDVVDGDDDVTERMMRSGYVKIDAAGIFTGDRYVEPYQIAAVEGDTVRLAIDKDDIEQPA